MSGAGHFEIALVFVSFLFIRHGVGVLGVAVEEKSPQLKNAGGDSVIWVAQLSDLHFSVHHPERALDFAAVIGPMLRIIQPSLVFVTGDLTDAKSQDMLEMRQNENEWIEYQRTMENVVKTSGLDRNTFYDLRGNHDNFGVPKVAGSYDFYSKYSINWRLGRTENVQSVTIETNERKHLFVSLDTTMSSGVRGPTNLFGHPTDELLSILDDKLSQWDSQPEKPVTKVAFGHFPLSFSAFTHSGKSLKDVFIKQKLSAYSCGHLHTRFGKNLKRHHQAHPNPSFHEAFFQLSIHQKPIGTIKNCSLGLSQAEEFWEWEMGDWRKSRVLRLIAIDKGFLSYSDIDFKAGMKQTIIFPTFPLDSRVMSTSYLYHLYECQYMIPTSFETLRTLVFSSSTVVSVTVRIFDSKNGIFDNVLEETMTKVPGYTSRGNMYAAPWNYKAFEDSDPLRFWLQIEVVDINGISSVSEPRPFSINGLSAKITWTWLEFKVMGLQWAALYYPFFWFFIASTLIVLLILPQLGLAFSKPPYTKRISSGLAWSSQQLFHLWVPYFGFIGYIFYILLFPLFSGRIYSDNSTRGFMTYKGWLTTNSEYLAYPDLMVIILPHLYLVLLPSVLVVWGLAAERSIFKDYMLSYSCKKEDDYVESNLIDDKKEVKKIMLWRRKRWMRKILLFACLVICWNHYQSCRRLMKAYDMRLLVDCPVYCLVIPFLLTYASYRTRNIQ